MMWKKRVTAVGLAGLLFLSSCGADGNTGAENAQDNEAQGRAVDEQKEVLQNKDSGVLVGNPEELTGELTILSWAPYAENVWNPIIEAFEEAHPGVTITIDFPEEYDMYMEGFATKVLSGEGYDIVQEADFASAKKGWADLGLFVDLYEFMDADENFHKEDFFSCIYGPVETDGKLLRFVRNVSPVYIRMNKWLLDRAGVEYNEETISFDELYEIYEKVREVCGEKIYLTEEADYNPLSNYEESYYIYNNLLDTDEYEEYLRKNHEMCYEEEARNTYTEYGQGIANDVFCRVLSIGLMTPDLLENIFEGTDDFAPAVLYVNSHGKHYSYASNSLSISSFSENKVLAWEFLKFVVGNYDVDYRDSGFVTPNKERLLKEYEGVKPEIRERIFQDIEAIDTVFPVDIHLGLNLDSILEDYYVNNTLTAQECRKEMAERVYLYMNE